MLVIILILLLSTLSFLLKKFFFWFFYFFFFDNFFWYYSKKNTVMVCPKCKKIFPEFSKVFNRIIYPKCKEINYIKSWLYKMGNRIEVIMKEKNIIVINVIYYYPIFNVHIAMKVYLIKKLLYQIYIIYNSGIEIWINYGSNYIYIIHFFNINLSKKNILLNDLFFIIIKYWI